MLINKDWYLRYMNEAGEGDDGAGAGSGGDQGAGDGDQSGAGAGDSGGDSGAGAGAAGDGAGGASPAWLSTTPEDWRKQLAGDNESLQKLLDRVPDLPTLVKNYGSAQERIRKGELSNGLPENATDEQIAEWREANGIPAAPDQYKLEPGDGLALGDEDTRIMEGVLQVAHKHNISNEAMNEITNAMLVGRQAEIEQIGQEDNMDKMRTTQLLKDTWGGDFNANINMVKGLVAQLPEDVRESFQNARLADGRALFNSPEVMTFFADLSRKVNPAGTVVPDANNPVQAINDEISALEKRMGDDDWHKDVAAQKRYQALITARDSMGAQNVT